MGEPKLSSLMTSYRQARECSGVDDAYLEGSRKVLETMYNLWLDQIMCDVIFETGGGIVLAHQVALAAFSPSLSVLFKSKQASSQLQQTAHINMVDFSLPAVADVINFVYTTDIELNDDNINQTLACARQLDITVMFELCADYLVKMADPENVILHYSVAANNDLAEIRDRLLTVICQGFTELYQHKHFSFLPFDRLKAILSNENLCAEELDIFHAIVAWIDTCREERLKFAGQLVPLIRLELIDPDQLVTEVQSVEWIFNDRDCMAPICNAYKFHALSCTKSPLLEKIKPPSKRSCTGRRQSQRSSNSNSSRNNSSFILTTKNHTDSDYSYFDHFEPNTQQAPRPHTARQSRRYPSQVHQCHHPSVDMANGCPPRCVRYNSSISSSIRSPCQVGRVSPTTSRHCYVSDGAPRYYYERNRTQTRNCKND